MNNDQIKLFRYLLAQIPFSTEERDKYKESLVMEFTNSRTKSSKDMSNNEAEALINFLKSKTSTSANQQQKPSINALNRKDSMTREVWEQGHDMRKKVKYYARQMNWDVGLTDEEFWACIDNFCMTRCAIKKPLNKYLPAELVAVVTQFEQLYNNHLNKKTSNEQTGNKQAQAGLENERAF